MKLSYSLCMAVFVMGLTGPASGHAKNSSAGAEVPDKLGGNDLFLSIVKGDVASAMSYISNNRFVNDSRSDGVTPLMVATIKKMNKVVTGLIQHGAKVDAVTASGKYGVAPGMSALMFASESGNAALVAELIKSGADVYLQDRKGMSALMYAVISNDFESVRLLVGAGAFDYHFVDRHGNTAMDIARLKKHKKIFDYLQKEYPKSISKQLPSLKTESSK